MTPESQRIAIAEACGFKGPFHRNMDRIKIGFKGFQGTMVCDLPDYLNDLNAMHEAEKVLRNKSGDHQLFRFISCLENVVVDQATDYGWGFALCHATAAQRAEAFLRTLGLWK